ncbi:MAG: SMP-30/gluconolactonase/LRE family protein [Planctomycetaceae bacterium]
MSPVVRAIGPRCVLGESPLWDGRTGHLLWVDIDGRQVHRWSWDTEEISSLTLADRPGSIALTADPETVLLASEHRIGLLHLPDGRIEWKITLPIPHDTVRLNDGRVSATGDFWVGSMHVPSKDRRFISAIYRIHPDWTWEPVVTEVGVANALVSTPAGMHWADTLHGACWIFDDATSIPVASGTGDPHVTFAAAGLEGGPDGACIDARHNVWVACVHGGALACFDPAGRLIERIELPVRRPTCPVFGGPDLRTLFLTTIGGGGNYPMFDDEPDAGRVLVLDVDRQGVPENVFRPAD